MDEREDRIEHLLDLIMVELRAIRKQGEPADGPKFEIRIDVNGPSDPDRVAASLVRTFSSRCEHARQSGHSQPGSREEGCTP